jgi:type II secretory pathway pseudopilin PulG
VKRIDAKRLRGRERSEEGFTLIEGVIATVVVSLTIATAITGLTTMSNASTHANSNARIDALLSGYGEALKAATYVDCAIPDNYQLVMDGLDAGSIPSERLAPDTATGDFKVDILSVENKPGCPRPPFGDGSVDLGTQSIAYRVTRTVGSEVQTRSAVIEKLDPEGGPSLPHAIIDTPVLTTTPGDVVASFSFTATGSFGEKYPIVRYEWNCDGRDETPINVMDFGTVSPDPTSLAVDRRGRDAGSGSDPTVHCVFPASATGPTTHTMSLFVHDSKGQISEEAQVTVTVAATLVARYPTRRSGHAYPRLWHGSVDRELLLGRVSLARWRHLLVRVELPGPRVGILQCQYPHRTHRTCSINPASTT